jgi:luciferase-like monooxygenase
MIRDELEERLVQRPGLSRRPSRYGDHYSYFVGTREIAHFHGDGRMDVRLTSELIRDLKKRAVLDPRVRTRGPTANWAAVPLEDESDLDLALEMVDLAMQANS